MLFSIENSIFYAEFNLKNRPNKTVAKVINGGGLKI